MDSNRAADCLLLPLLELSRFPDVLEDFFLIQQLTKQVAKVSRAASYRKRRSIFYSKPEERGVKAAA